MNRSSLLPDSQTDADLLSASAAGDKRAFEALYDRFERRVYRYVRTFIRSETLAEDVVIDTMTAVWRGAQGFGQSSRVSTWIFGIARHKALDAVRKTGSRPEPVTLDEIDEPVGDEDPQADIEGGHDADVMQRAMSRLSEDHQEILRLAFYEDLPYDEIATLLSIPDNTVKTRVFYAKQRLKQHLARFGIESAQ